MSLNELKILSLTSQTKLNLIPAPVLKKSMNFHFLLSWDKNKTPELMFELKKMIKEFGKIYFPVNFDEIEMEHKLKLMNQIEDKAETRLYLTNWECLHAFRLNKIVMAPSKKFFSDNAQKIHPSFLQPTSKELAWFELDDIFILHANHTQDDQILELEKEFSCLWNVENFKNFSKDKIDQTLPLVIVDTSGLSIFSRQDLKASKNADVQKWIQLDRSFTNEYYLRNCYLKDYIYHQAWDTFQRSTQHLLNELGRVKSEGSQLAVNEKFLNLESCFNHYLMAIKSELEHYYLKPIIEVLVSTNSLKDLKNSGVCKELENLKNYQLLKSSTACLINTIKEAKASVFTMKRKLNKELVDENSIMAEKILNNHEKMLEAFYRNNILNDLEVVNGIENWLMLNSKNFEHLGQDKQNILILKLNMVLSRLTGSNFSENVLLKIYQHNHGHTLGDKNLMAIIHEIKHEIAPNKIAA